MSEDSVVKNDVQEEVNTMDFSQVLKFGNLSKLILRDLNKNQPQERFQKYTKDKILDFLKDPAKNEKNLKDANIYMYGASSHYRRLIQYFVSLTDFSYIVSPYKVDVSSVNQKTFRNQYNKCMNFLSTLDIKNIGDVILTVAFREDTFYGTFWINSDSVIVQQLPSNQCKIASIENNVPNVSFDFSYFDSDITLLDKYPEEFRTKYNIYLRDKDIKWQELDSPTSFAVKVNKDILSYSLPPFSAILPNLYDLEDYKALTMVKSELDNYALLVMKLAMTQDGGWAMDFETARQFWGNLSHVLPDEIGSVLSPMTIEKIDFRQNSVSEVDRVDQSEKHLFAAAGVPSQLFSNDKSSSSALNLAIKVDQAFTYSVVLSIQAVLNRLLHGQSFGKNFTLSFLDSSMYNREELSSQYLKAAQSGMPTVSLCCASLGLHPSDIEGMNFMEDTILDIKNKFIPLKVSTTMTKEDAGRPASDTLDDSGEQTREDDLNDNR